MSVGTTLRYVLAVSACLVLPACAVAAPVSQRISQYDHTAWRKQDGVGAANALAQARDGFLWIGTATGVVRFDGVRFESKNQFDGASIEGRSIHAIFGARDGSLWIGTAGDVEHVVGNHLERYAVEGWVNQFAQDKDGTLWFVQTRANFLQGPLCSIAHQRLACVGKPSIPHANFESIVVDPAGGLWAAGTEGLCHWSGTGPADCHLRDMLGPDYGRLGVTALHLARDGTLWVGIGNAGHPYGIGRFANGRWTPVVAPDGSSLDVTAIAEDHEGGVWVGTLDHGLYRIVGDDIDHYGRADGLSTDEINDLFIDAEGTLWVATDNGVEAFRKLRVSTFSSVQGLPGNDVSAVAAAQDGTVWIGTQPLSALRGDKPASVPHPEWFAGKQTTALLVDHAGRRWVGLGGQLVVADGQALRTVVDAAGHPTGSIIRLVEDASHAVWAQTTGPATRLLRIVDFKYDNVPFDGLLNGVAADREDGVWLSFRDGTSALLRQGRLQQRLREVPGSANIQQEADGTLLSASDHGLSIRRGPVRALLDAAHGLPCDSVQLTIRDKQHALWLITHCGFVKIDAPEFDRWLSQPASRIRFRMLDASDGFQFSFSGFYPVATLAPDGRFWLASDKFVQVVDPSLSMAPRPAPPVLIDEVLADRKAYPAGGALKLPERTRDLEIRYNAPSFIAPRKIRFKYRLEGRDRDWTDADTRRDAFYTDLAPGAYRFRVIAGNSEGVWNDVGASVDVDIAAAFYQTRWFAVLCGLAALGLVWVATMLRLHQLSTRVRLQIEARSRERERIARELHDTMLQGTQGLVLSFQVLANDLPPQDRLRLNMEGILDHADEVIAQARDSVAALRGADAEAGAGDLRQRLQDTVGELSPRAGAVATIEVSGPERPLHDDVLEEAWRIGREALLNAFRHAQARAIHVQLDYGTKTFRLAVDDDGIGIDAATLSSGMRPGHWGLTGMRERAWRIDGTLALTSGDGAGTQIELRVPAARAYVDTRPPPRWRKPGWLRRLVSAGAHDDRATRARAVRPRT